MLSRPNWTVVGYSVAISLVIGGDCSMAPEFQVDPSALPLERGTMDQAFLDLAPAFGDQEVPDMGRLDLGQNKARENDL